MTWCKWWQHGESRSIKTWKIWILLFRYSIPAIIAMMVVTSLYNVVDRAFIGSMEGIGSIAIAGLGVTMPVFTLIIAFGMLVSEKI